MSIIEVIAGAQYGSEAKGHVTAQIVKAHLAEGRSVVNVRVAGPNAGHTVYDAAGRKFAFRSIPVGAVLGDQVLAYIAPGSEVDPDVLFREWDEMRAAEHNPKVLISPSATLMDPRDGEAETEAGIQARLGSTSKGIGEARIRRLRRTAQRVGDNSWFVNQCAIRNIEFYEPHEVYPGQDVIVIEGTQGYGLSLHGEAYPFVTSSDCRAIDFLAMASVNPWSADDDLRITLVARMYPIRVAGNSGPLHDETSWEELGLPEERTTVTQKVRRVGHWDDRLVRAAVRDNGGHSGKVALAVTMVDQRFAEEAGFDGAFEDLGPDARGWLESLESRLATPIRMVTTGPKSVSWKGHA